jgi:phosphatidyl-myo-inositol dimannoside synthase
MGARGREWVGRTWTWEHTAERLEALLTAPGRSGG